MACRSQGHPPGTESANGDLDPIARGNSILSVNNLVSLEVVPRLLKKKKKKKMTQLIAEFDDPVDTWI